jgi:DNA polymerase IV
MTKAEAVPGFCRDCLHLTCADENRCLNCHSPRLLRHAELNTLSIAHIDCDAFYAAVEKRDNPALLDKPVIVGGQTRGVVSTACYIARIHGVKSAMPMFKALQLCPEAVVVKPNMAKYAEAGANVREIMLQFTPLVQPISIDEAFLDLSGTERLHGSTAALTLAKLIKKIETEVGITSSIGLSHNKFLAKLASDLEKPRGFSVIGKAEARSVLAPKSVQAIWGVGQAMQQKLAKNGITTIGQLQGMEKNDLFRSYGSMGARLYYLSRGEDDRHVSIEHDTKTISAETTFDENISSYEKLESILWDLCLRVSHRAKSAGFAGHTINLKLKTGDFKSRTRAVSLQDATRLAHRIFEFAKPLLQKESTGTKFRLLGVGISNLVAVNQDDDVESLDTKSAARSKAEMAMDKIKEKFGKSAVELGHSFKNKNH